MDLDQSESELCHAEPSPGGNHQHELPALKRNLGSTSKPTPGLRSSSASSTEDQHSDDSLASRYNFGLDAVPEEDKDERKVERAGKDFVDAVIRAIMTAALSSRGSNSGRWRITTEVA